MPCFPANSDPSKFTGRSVDNLEYTIDERIVFWIESLRHSSSKVVDIGQKIQSLTRHITFGASGLIAVAIGQHTPSI